MTFSLPSFQFCSFDVIWRDNPSDGRIAGSRRLNVRVCFSRCPTAIRRANELARTTFQDEMDNSLQDSLRAFAR